MSDLPKEFWQKTYDVFKKITEIKKSLQLKNGIEPFYLGKDKVPVPTIFKSLTSFVTHGVSTTTAVYAISLGVKDRQIAIALSNAYQIICPETEYSKFKEWLFSLSHNQWKEMVQIGDDSINKIDECFNEVQKKQRKLEKQSTTFDCSLCRENGFIKNNETINKNDLIIVRFDEQLYLVSYDYLHYWKLDGDNVDKLSQYDRQINDFIVNHFDQQMGTVSISVY